VIGLARSFSAATSWRRALNLALSCAVLSLLVPTPGALRAEQPFISLASTTSTDNSGLFAHLLPAFTAATGIEVRVIAQGTGQALRTARSGDADVLMVHHPPSEEAFVAEGYGVERIPIMYNDFVVVGADANPAGIGAMEDAVAGFDAIAGAEAVFVSRGDDSGTHRAEQALWADAGVDVAAASGTWYREAGAGMGATLNIAADLGAYTLADRATWIAFQNKRSLRLLLEGDQRLFNQYSVILVNPERHPHIKTKLGEAFVDWVKSEAGQSAIDTYRLDGQQ